MPDLLFIYGTLHPDRAPAEIAAVARTLTPLGPASIRGTLLDLGAYPGVLLGHAQATDVPGHLFALPEPPDATWSKLDAYEDFRPDHPETSLFVRKLTVATLPDRTQRRCWVYVYNQRNL